MKQAVGKPEQMALAKQLVVLASPLILSNLAYTLLGAVDTIFLGRVSAVSLGAVGLGTMVFLTVSLLFRGTVNGTTTFVARMYGANKFKQAGTYLKYFLVLALLLTPVVFILPWAFRIYFTLLAPEPQVALETMAYVTIRLWELPFSLITTTLIGFLVGVGNSRTPMMLSWVAVLINIGANYVLIFGHFGFPALGIVGAAWGTVIAVFIQTLIAIWIVFTQYRGEYGLSSLEIPTLKELKKMVLIGFPIGLTESAEVGAFATFFAFISRLGTIELAASQIANQVASVAFMPGFALSIATGSLVGRYMGADKLSLARRVGFLGAYLGAISMGALGVLFWLFSNVFGRIFTTDPQVLALTGLLLQIVAFYQAFDGFNIVFRGALNGAGDTRFTMTCTLLAAWLLFIPGVYFFGFILDFGLVGTWIGAFLYITVLGITFGWRFASNRWQSITLR